MNFIKNYSPIEIKNSNRLAGQDLQCNTFDLRFTYSLKCPSCSRQDLIVVPNHIFEMTGHKSRLMICHSLGRYLTLIDPFSANYVRIDAKQYWSKPFDPIMTHKQLKRFAIISKEIIGNSSSTSNRNTNKNSNNKGSNQSETANSKPTNRKAAKRANRKANKRANRAFLNEDDNNNDKKTTTENPKQEDNKQIPTENEPRSNEDGNESINQPNSENNSNQQEPVNQPPNEESTEIPNPDTDTNTDNDPNSPTETEIPDQLPPPRFQIAELELTDEETYSDRVLVRTHLGFLLNEGDVCYGYDLREAVFPDEVSDSLKKTEFLSGVVVVARAPSALKKK